MYRKFISTVQLLNILFQALYSLALPIGIGALASFLLTKYTSVDRWIWAVLLTVGTLIGFYSMIKYILTAIAGLERLEKERAESLAEAKEKEARRERLNAELIKNEGEGDD